MTLVDHALKGKRLWVAGNMVTLDIGLPWYRSLPLGAIVGIEFSVDGEQVEHVHLAGIPVADLAGHASTYWPLRDHREVSGVLAGSRPRVAAQVRFVLRLALPYLMIRPGQPAVVEQELAGLLPVDVMSA